jgi:hypothetical protein
MIVTLVARTAHADLVRYLEGVGFAVRARRTSRGAPREGTLVWLTEHHSAEGPVVETVRAWLGAKPELRAIVVTDRPVRIRELANSARIIALPAPVFGWQLVDALREGMT